MACIQISSSKMKYLCNTDNYKFLYIIYLVQLIQLIQHIEIDIECMTMSLHVHENLSTIEIHLKVEVTMAVNILQAL